MTTLQSIQQIEHIKIYKPFAYNLVDCDPFIVIIRVLNIVEAGDQPRLRKKFLYLTKRHLLQQNQKTIVLIKAFVCRFCESILCPLSQPAEILAFKRSHEQTEIINCNQYF